MLGAAKGKIRQSSKNTIRHSYLTFSFENGMMQLPGRFRLKALIPIIFR
jgi:hypothetical protein